MRSSLIVAGVLILTACGQEAMTVTSCADLTQACVLNPDGNTIRVQANQAPSALQPFELKVHAPQAKSVHAEFKMHDMEMGLNRYRLLPQPGGEWRARVTLPVCVTGRRDWLLILELDGERQALAFQAG